MPYVTFLMYLAYIQCKLTYCALFYVYADCMMYCIICCLYDILYIRYMDYQCRY